MAEAAGIACTPSAVHGALKRLGITRKKMARRAAELDRPGLIAERAAWRREFASIDPARLVFVDESGASTAMDRTHGRCASGKRVDGPAPHGHWKVLRSRRFSAAGRPWFESVVRRDLRLALEAMPWRRISFAAVFTQQGSSRAAGPAWPRGLP